MTASINDVIRIIGQEAADELVAAYGGRRLYVPTRIRSNHPLAIRLGCGPAILLAKAFGGDRIEVPTRRALDIRDRNRAIIAEHAAGVPQSALANRYQLTVRQIRNITRNGGANA